MIIVVGLAIWSLFLFWLALSLLVEMFGKYWVSLVCVRGFGC